MSAAHSNISKPTDNLQASDFTTPTDQKTELVEKHGHAQFLKKLADKGLSYADIEDIDFAYEQAKAAHRGILRKGGERYFEHVRAVAEILIDECNVTSKNLIISAFLHDVVEDTALYGSNAVPGRDPRVVAYSRLSRIFNTEVASTVMYVTKKPKTSDSEINKAQHLEYLQGLMGAPIAALLIKMADRLHNLRSLEATSLEHQKKQLQETKQEYMPIFERALKIESTFKDASLILFTKIGEELKILEKRLENT